MKLCVSSSRYKYRPTKGEPAQVGSEPCDSPRNRAARFLGAPPPPGGVYKSESLFPFILVAHLRPLAKARTVLLACLCTYVNPSTPRSSRSSIVQNPCGWDHDGTRQRNTPRSTHPWSIKPAALAGVQGRHCFAE